MLQTKHILLRDLREEDIEQRIRWETVETEWQQWDAPWEYEGLTEAERQEELRHYTEELCRRARQNRTRPEEELRLAFQIETKGERPEYIGWVTSYCLDEDCNYTEERTDRRAVGLDIPERAARGRGFAYQALGLFLPYLMEHGETKLFTQTWSGNERMVYIARTLGFEECRRKKGFRTVRGEKYDGLTFRLNPDKFENFCQNRLRPLL